VCMCVRACGMGVEYDDEHVCLCVCMHISGTTGQTSQNLLCMLPVAVASSSSGGILIHCVLLVL